MMIPPLDVEVLIFIPAVLHSTVKCSSVHWRSNSVGAKRIMSSAINIDVTSSGHLFMFDYILKNVKLNIFLLLTPSILLVNELILIDLERLKVLHH